MRYRSRHYPSMRQHYHSCYMLGLISAVIAGNSVQAEPPGTAIKVTVTPGRTWTFGPDQVTFDTNFPRARLNECEQLPGGEFELLIRPENKPINHSPWFAFKVSAAK